MFPFFFGFSTRFISVEVGRGGDIIMSLCNLKHGRGQHVGTFEKNRRRIYATESRCGICGRPVDFDLKFPDPMAATIDHIIPINKGGHPSDIENLQLAHNRCNRLKSDKLFGQETQKIKEKNDPKNTNRDLPQKIDWSNYVG